MADKDLTNDEIEKELTNEVDESGDDFDFEMPADDSAVDSDADAEDSADSDASDDSDANADESLADDSTPAGVDEAGKPTALPPEGTTRDFSGIQDDVHQSPENEDPDEESKHDVEPDALPVETDSDDEEEETPHISKSGNKVFEEKEALHPVGQIHNAGSTAAYIEVVQPRQPGLEAMLRASATQSGLDDGSIKPEDAPGHNVPEGGINPESGGRAEDGNSITGATKPSEDWAINPNSPTQVGDTKETAAAASAAKVENGDATSGDIEEGKTTLQSSATGFSPMEFTEGKPEQLQEKY